MILSKSKKYNQRFVYATSGNVEYESTLIDYFAGAQFKNI